VITGAIVSSLAGLAVSYIAGDLLGVILGKGAIGGFGGASAKTLKVGKLRHALWVTDTTEKTRNDLIAWCDENSEAANTHGLRPMEPTS